MSTTNVSGGGSSGDSTDSTTDDTAGSTGGGPAPDTDSDGGGLSGVDLTKRIGETIVGMFPFLILFKWMSVEEFLRFLEQFILETIVGWIAQNVIRPIIDAVLWLGGSLIDAVLLLFLGGDRAFGGDSVGVADFLPWIADEFIAATGGPIDEIIGVINGFNQEIAEIGASAGLAAPGIVTVLYTVEVLAAVYILWSVIRVIDVPFVSLDGLVEVALAPFKLVLRRL